jgi:predicted enzyme related to lactoylglutathione lyase
MPITMPWRVAPVLIVDDVVATANFYRDQLGFAYERFWGEPPCFCMVYRKGVILMLSQMEGVQGQMRPNSKVDPHGECWDAYLWVDDADTLYAEYQARGVTIARPICEQPYGNRDFDVLDCNGYRLCFGSDSKARG